MAAEMVGEPVLPLQLPTCSVFLATEFCSAGSDCAGSRTGSASAANNVIAVIHVNVLDFILASDAYLKARSANFPLLLNT